MVTTAKTLRDTDSVEGNVIVYIVRTKPSDAGYMECVSAFHDMYKEYTNGSTLSAASAKCDADLTLQMISIESLISTSSPVVMSHTEHVRLCFEIYDKCTITDRGTSGEAWHSGSAPAVMLAQSGPKRVQLKISTDASYAPLHEKAVLHLAYSCSPDDRWVSAAWSDEVGETHGGVSFCRARTTSAAFRPFSHIAKEMIATVMDATPTKVAGWRLMVVKVGSVTSEEVDGKLVDFVVFAGSNLDSLDYA